jgi:hypothetical protein
VLGCPIPEDKSSTTSARFCGLWNGRFDVGLCPGYERRGPRDCSRGSHRDTVRPSALRPGETRLQVLQRNVAVFEQLVASILQDDAGGRHAAAGDEMRCQMRHDVNGVGQEALERSASILHEAIESLKLT